MRDRMAAWPGPARWASAFAALAAAWLIAAIVLPKGAPAGIVLSGVVFGCATALTTMGIILIYRSNRVVNFAAAAMGSATGFSAIRLFLLWHWNYELGIVVGTTLGVAIGLLVEILVIRRFQRSSRLILAVATLGIAQLLGGIEVLLPGWIFSKKLVTFGGFETPLSSFTFNVGVAPFTGNDVLILVAVPLVLGGLGWFLMRSAYGKAVRAIAENADRARLLGIPVKRLNTMVWALAGGLAALGYMLQSPFQGTSPSLAGGPKALLPALAAAVVGGMESLPVGCVAAVVLGAVTAVVRWNSGATPAITDVVPLAAILGSLLLRRAKSSRAYDVDGTWQDAASVRPIAPRIARLPEVRAMRMVLALGALVAVVVIPQVVSPTTVNTMTLATIWGMIAVSLVVLTGWNGQMSLGQFALVGVGAITFANLLHRSNLDLFAALAISSLVTALVALLIGVPALRVRGPFLGVATLAFAVMLDNYVLNQTNFPSLAQESVERPVLLQRWPLQSESALFYLTAGLLLFVMILAAGVRRARSGRLLIGARDNRRAAEAMSVPSRFMSLQGFLLAGAIAGLAGGLEVLVLGGIGDGSFPAADSVTSFSMATIGGLTSPFGAFTGAALLRWTQAKVGGTAAMLVTGVGLLVVLMIFPAGLGGLLTAVRDRVLRVVAARRGLDISGQPLVESVESVRDGDHESTPRLTVESSSEGAGPMIRCSDIRVSYGQLQVLFDVDLDVADGELVALLGTNGAGKSTLLKAMCGLVPYKGSVVVAGLDLTGKSAEEIVATGVALMPGGKSIFPTLTVEEHLRLATWTFRRDAARIAADTESVLELFPALRRRFDNMAGDMSGGEQQQLALAQTLLLRPRVLMIDELSLGLAPSIVAQLLEVVRGLHRDGTTIVIVEQSINVALTLAQRAVFMEKGQVRFEGPTADLLDRPDILRSVFLEGASAVTHMSAAPAAADPLEGIVVGAEQLAPVPVAPLAASANNGSLPSPPPPSATLDAAAITLATDPILDCRGVTKRFGGVLAVEEVDLAVRPGEVVGLVGQNGAGKTTLLDCISGFHTIDGGRVLFNGDDITEWAPFRRARVRLARSFQEARLFPSLSVAETIAVACERLVASRSMIGDALCQPASFESELSTSARVEDLVDFLGLGAHHDRLISELSTGTRRIVELACLLAAEPLMLLLDEPSAGVAQRETEALGPLLLRIRDRTGAAVLVIEHDMALLAAISDRMVALELGAVIAEGTPDEVLANDRVVASYLGTDAAAINRSGLVTAP